jgi:hypothetical protein
MPYWRFIIGSGIMSNNIGVFLNNWCLFIINYKASLNNINYYKSPYSIFYIYLKCPNKIGFPHYKTQLFGLLLELYCWVSQKMSQLDKISQVKTYQL